jgi:hypothetical protein
MSDAYKKRNETGDQMYVDEALANTFYPDGFPGTRAEAIKFGAFVFEMMQNGQSPYIEGIGNLILLQNGKLGWIEKTEPDCEPPCDIDALAKDAEECNQGPDRFANTPDVLGLFNGEGPPKFMGRPIPNSVAHVLNRYIKQTEFEGSSGDTKNDEDESMSGSETEKKCNHEVAPDQRNSKQIRRVRKRQRVKEIIRAAQRIMQSGSGAASSSDPLGEAESLHMLD